MFNPDKPFETDTRPLPDWITPPDMSDEYIVVRRNPSTGNTEAWFHNLDDNEDKLERILGLGFAIANAMEPTITGPNDIDEATARIAGFHVAEHGPDEPTSH